MYIKYIFFLLIFSLNVLAQDVITTLPEFAWAVKELSPKTKVKSLLNGSEDPHFVDASPGFVFKIAKAELLVFNGLQLEIGWLGKVIQLSGNSKIQIGAKGYCDASKGVSKIESLSTYDRSMGDVHPAGNPHYTISIPRMIESVSTIKECLISLGIDKEILNKNFEILKTKMNAKFKSLKKRTPPSGYYVYHREFNYLQKDFNFKFYESLEKVPGVLPSATYLGKMAIKSKKDKPLKVLAGNTSPTKILEKFKELSGVEYVKLNLHPKQDEDYLSFIENIMSNLVKSN